MRRWTVATFASASWSEAESNTNPPEETATIDTGLATSAHSVSPRWTVPKTSARLFAARWATGSDVTSSEETGFESANVASGTVGAVDAGLAFV
jgi:hypothetical protein